MNMPRGNGEYTEIAALIQKMLEPLSSNISKVDAKVDRAIDKVEELARDRVTRADIDNLRKEIQSAFVLRAEYEPRHEALIARDAQLESEIKRIDTENENESKRIHERLESGKQQIEDRFKDLSKEIDGKLNEKNQAELSAKDKGWIRAGQIGFFVSLLIVVTDFVSQHIQLH